MEYSAIKKSRQVNRELDNKTESKRFYEEVYKHYGPIKKLFSSRSFSIFIV